MATFQHCSTGRPGWMGRLTRHRNGVVRGESETVQDGFGGVGAGAVVAMSALGVAFSNVSAAEEPTLAPRAR